MPNKMTRKDVKLGESMFFVTFPPFGRLHSLSVFHLNEVGKLKGLP